MGDSLAFSATNRAKFLQRAANTDFDFVFTSCGFREAMFCLFAANQGFKCAIFCPEDFSCKLHPVVELKTANHKALVLLQKSFPHLILPDEYLNINPKMSAIKSLLTANISHRDLSKYEALLKVKDGDRVYLDREFKLNANRLLISILKTAVQVGVTVLNYISVEKKNSSSLLACNKLKKESAQVVLISKQILELEEQTKCSGEMELHILLDRKHLFLKRSLKFTVQNQLVRLVRYQDYFLLICKTDKNEREMLRSVLNHLNNLLYWEDKFEEEDVIACQISRSFEWLTIDRQLSSLEEMTNKYLGFSSRQFLEHISNINAVDTHFEGKTEIQQLIEYGDFRFDEAKQTGIHPIAFKNMFYRFGSEIEQLTEAAYEGRSKFGSGNKLWEYVQFWNLFQTEMICHKQDYFNRIGKKEKFSKYDLIASEQIIDDCFSNA